MTPEERDQKEDCWKEYRTEQGKPFYYNAKLKKSVWKMPAEYKEQLEREDKERKLQQKQNMEEEERKRKEREEELRRQEAIIKFKEYMKEKQVSK